MSINKMHFFLQNIWWVQKKALPLHPLSRKDVLRSGTESSKSHYHGAVVQLVRIPACHAVGREFESRPHRKAVSTSLTAFVFYLQKQTHVLEWETTRLASL